MSWYGHDMEGVMITGPAAAAGARESLQERICKGVAAAAELLSQNLMLPTTCVSPLGAILLDDFFCFTPLDNSMTFSVVENETCAAVLSSSCETEEMLLSHVQVVDSVYWIVNTLRTFCPRAIQICVS